MWILDAMWKLVDKRVSARLDPAKDQSLIRRLGRAIAASLKGDMQRQAKEAGAEVEVLLGLEPPFYRESWHRIKGWSWDVVYFSPPPARVTLAWITEEWV